ncbi:hypothetical protein U1Q18_007164 [Sarracenia purpurea var. burkii]
MEELCTNLANSWKKMERGLRESVSKSKVGKYFKLEARKSCFTRELRAGTASFLTMAYIVTVNATILADSGAVCSVSDCTAPTANQKAGPDCTLKPNPGYQSCLSKVKADLIVATALSSMIGSFAMGFLANLPLYGLKRPLSLQFSGLPWIWAHVLPNCSGRGLGQRLCFFSYSRFWASSKVRPVHTEAGAASLRCRDWAFYCFCGLTSPPGCGPRRTRLGNTGDRFSMHWYETGDR